VLILLKYKPVFSLYINKGLSWSWSYGSWIYNYLCNQCLSPLMLWVRISLRARCTTLCDKVCQWLATGQWFSLGPPVSFTNKIDRHDIIEILLKVALNTMKQTITCHKSSLNRFRKIIVINHVCCHNSKYSLILHHVKILLYQWRDDT
jgi:hypothetical protein